MEAMNWAEKNLCKVYSDEETGGKGEFEIVPKVVGKYVSKVARDKSENEYYHYVVLRNLPSLIHDSIEVETHPNFLSHGAKKVEGDTRYDMNALVHILYGAVLIKGELCRVKITVKEYPSNKPSRPYTFEVTGIDTNIEPSKPIGDEAQRLGRDFNDSIPAAKLLKGVEKSYDPGKKLLDESEDLPEDGTFETEEQSQIANEEGISKCSLRTKPAPKKTQKVYKLMRLGEDGKLYPLFIDSSEPIEMGNWYDADSPGLDMMKNMPSGVHLIDTRKGESMSLDEFAKEHPEMFKGGKVGVRPSKEAVNYATANGLRWVKIDDTSRGQRRFGGEARKYWNIGINGSGAVSDFSMRPGWHAGSLPTMRQIGKGKEKNMRDDRFVWVEGEVPADIDYNEEAQRNADKDIPDHIPTDGFYMKATNADAVKSQADMVGWYVAGSFKADRVISDSEARSIIDRFNREHGMDGNKKVLYDYDREGGVPFSEEDARRINEQNGEKASLRGGTFIRSGSYFSGGGLWEEGLNRDSKRGIQHEMEIGRTFSNTKEYFDAVRKTTMEIRKACRHPALLATANIRL